MQSPYLVEHRHMAVKRCKHGLFMYNRNDAFVGRGLDLYGEWCEFEIQRSGGFRQAGDTVIDAGANIGTHTVAFANFVGPAAPSTPSSRNAATSRCWPATSPSTRSRTCSAIRRRSATRRAKSDCRRCRRPTRISTSAPCPIARMREAGETVPLVTLELAWPFILPPHQDRHRRHGAAGACRRTRTDRALPAVPLRGEQRARRIAGAERDARRTRLRAWWSISAYYDPRNFYANTVNVWQNVVPSANLICTPKEAKVTLGSYEPFLGAADDWKACLQRMQERAKK